MIFTEHRHDAVTDLSCCMNTSCQKSLANGATMYSVAELTEERKGCDGVLICPACDPDFNKEYVHLIINEGGDGKFHRRSEQVDSSEPVHTSNS